MRSGIGRYAILLAGCSLLISACAGLGGPDTSVSKSTRTDITVWHTLSDANAEAFEEMVQKFNSTHPSVTVKAESVGDDDLEYRKLLAAAKRGDLPELAALKEDAVADLMRGNLIQPLDQYLKGSDGLSKANLDDIFPVYFESNRFAQYDAQLLSLPFAKDEIMAYYNVDLLTAAGVDRLPETWDEFAAAMEKVKAYTQSKRMPFNGAEALNTDASNVVFRIMSRGGKLLGSDASKVAFNNDPALTALRFDSDAAKTGVAYLYKGLDFEADFAGQRTAAFIDSSTTYTSLEPLVDKAPQHFKWAVAAPPSEVGRMTVVSGPNLAMLKSSPEKQAAAWQFMKWFTDSDQTAIWSTKTHYLPSRRSAASNADFKKRLDSNQALKASFELLPFAHSEPNVAGWPAVRDILREAEIAAVTQTASPKTAVEDAAKKADKALEDARS